MKMKDFSKLEEKKVSSEEVYDGVLLHVYKDQVELPDGKPSVRELIKLLGAVAIVPVTYDGKVIVERQFRYPMERVMLEIPAGKIDSVDEDPLDAAKRELREETGYSAGTWISLGNYQPSPAYCQEKIVLYLATGLEKGVQELDEGEFLNVEEIPLEDLYQDVLDGKIEDGKTQVAIMKAYAMLNK